MGEMSLAHGSEGTKKITLPRWAQKYPKVDMAGKYSIRALYISGRCERVTCERDGAHVGSSTGTEQEQGEDMRM